MENRIIKDKTDLIKLLSNTYTGYIWMVEHQKPIIHTKEKLKIEELEYRKNPHNKIQEAYLYDDKNSIHIKNIDGKELFYIFNEKKFKEKNEFKIDTEVVFPSHIKEINGLKFKQVYQLTKSLSGDGFETWQPIVRLFKGFN